MGNPLQHIADLVHIMYTWGIRDVVMSPGSRNAPLIHGFVHCEQVSCHSIPDERVAGYFALGIALKTGRPVIVLCTSGTAALNLAPALAEAYYQHVPLVAITADRPADVVETQQNQTLLQEDLFNNYTKGFLNWSHESADEKALEALLCLAAASHPGPIHLNVPIKEPLYRPLPQPRRCSLSFAPKEVKRDMIPEDLVVALQRAQRILILCGQQRPDPSLLQVLKAIAQRQQAVVVAEAVSNLNDATICYATDALAAHLLNSDDRAYVPDLMFSTGGHIVSKQWLLWMQRHPELVHWRISEAPDQLDTYGNLSGLVVGESARVLQALFPNSHAPCSAYVERWRAFHHRVEHLLQDHLREIPFSDLYLFGQLVSNLPKGSHLHLGNGSAIRYAQMFPLDSSLTVYGNRGVSGIDGSLSTAVGISKADPSTQNILLIGDMSFVYDSNALWNRNMPSNLHIVIINNGGGGIFRLMEGPSQYRGFEDYQVAHHPVALGELAKAFGWSHRLWQSKEDLQKGLPILLDPPGRTIIEVKTPVQENGNSYQSYYKKLKNNR